MKRAWLVSALAGVGALAAVAAWAQQRDLTVVSWGGAYQDAQREVYFLDPDGLKLEGMYFPPKPRRKAKKKR